MNVRLTLFDTNNPSFFMGILVSIRTALFNIRKQEGLYQNKVNSSLVSFCHCKMAYSVAVHFFFLIFLIKFSSCCVMVILSSGFWLRSTMRRTSLFVFSTVCNF